MFKSYAFTIRPRNGADPNLQVAIEKWCKKQDYYFLCAEGKEEARHLHGQVWLKEARDKGTINKSLERICEKTVENWDPAQRKVLRSGTKIAYSSNFTEEYLSKEDGWILNNPPEDESLFYPSKEEQDKVQLTANAVDKRYNRLCIKFKEENPDWSDIKGLYDQREATAKFLSNAMFKYKTEVVIADKKARTQLCECLMYYIWSSAPIEAFLTNEQWDLHKQYIQNNTT